MLNNPENAKKYHSRIPLSRAAVLENFVGVVVYLASNASSMDTAHILSVDEGAEGGIKIYALS